LLCFGHKAIRLTLIISTSYLHHTVTPSTPLKKLTQNGNHHRSQRIWVHPLLYLNVHQLIRCFSYVLAVAASTFVLSVWHGARVTPLRKPAKVPYPNCYASAESIVTCDDPKEKEAKYIFNCAQRAHANFMENYPVALTGLLISGLKYPVASAVTGVVWTVSRIAYAIGYTRRDRTDGKGRYSGGLGGLFWAAQITWLGMVGKMGLDLVLS
jgi:glutathione S-transferase